MLIVFLNLFSHTHDATWSSLCHAEKKERVKSDYDDDDLIEEKLTHLYMQKFVVDI